MRGRTPGFIALVVALVMLPGGPAMAADQGVDVQDNAFVPPTVTIAQGDRVTWTQSGSNPHSVTAEDDSFDSHPNCPPVCMGEGDEFSRTFDEPGEYGYFCRVHGAPGQGMAGTVVVQAAGGQPDDEPVDEPDPAQDDPDADERGEDDLAEDDPAGDGTAADDIEQLPHTGGGPLAIVGVLLFAGGVLVFRRRGRHPTD